MELKDLDKLHEVGQLMDGIRDNLIMLESSAIKEIPSTVCGVFETALEKAISLLSDVPDGLLYVLEEDACIFYTALKAADMLDV